MPRGVALVILYSTPAGQSNLHPLPNLVSGPTATELPLAEGPTEDLNKLLAGPTVPATVHHVLTTGDAVGTITGVVSTTWTALESLGSILSLPALENLVKAIDELAKVRTVIPL
jgi:hypothetical protein